MPIKHDRYWTGRDYSPDLKKALRFKDRAQVNRWLHVHRHLRPFLAPVWVETEETQEKGAPSDADPT
jgi:hypothetical protein